MFQYGSAEIFDKFISPAVDNSRDSSVSVGFNTPVFAHFLYLLA